MFIAVKSNNMDIIRFLIESKADLNSKAEVTGISKLQHDHTALYVAAHCGHSECVEFLLKNGADIDYLTKVANIH